MFKIGDRVTWFDDSYADACDSRAQLGDGPFEIISVENIAAKCEDIESTIFFTEAARQHAGHTQFVTINVDPGEHEENRFSGAFFRKIP
jgi:hypothetical protein